ncbi:MAG: hypothetical protein L3J06_02220 [Cyclobacteriaceae bacterium]|nr:hypothetical protein [Cyclobacteriaceae bacterium]
MGVKLSQLEKTEQEIAGFQEQQIVSHFIKMKLSQLYANKSFKNIVFNDGINLVLAKVIKKLDLSKDLHNLEKTTLIEVIDFMILRGVKEDYIFKKYQEKFSGYVFVLEILLNTGEYLTIKQAVDSPTKISFKTRKVSTYLLEEKWNKSNISFDKAGATLNEYLAFDVLNQWPYRKSVTYFLRSQKDYNDVFQRKTWRYYSILTFIYEN